MKDVKVTIIVPIHNSERYLKECIESAVSQSFKDIEILCIDGGSTDASPEIIEEIQKKDDRVVYISDTNTGYGHKLNLGIGRAKGSYIAILESDDKMSPQMIEYLYDIAKRYNVDIVDSDYYCFLCHNDREYWEVGKKYSDAEYYGRLIEYNDIDDIQKEIAENGIWTALYKKSFLKRKKIYLNESSGASYQDTSFLFLTSLLAESEYHLNIPLYRYRVDNEKSSVKDDKKIFEIIGEFNFLKQELKRRGIQKQDIWKKYYSRKYKIFYWNYRRLSVKGRKLFLDGYLQELKSDIQNRFITREMFEASLYDCTFLLVDDKDKFVKTVDKNDRSQWNEEFCRILDGIAGRDIVIFGAGVWGIRLITMLQQNENRILAICDNSKQIQGTVKLGFKVLSVEETVKSFSDVLFVIANRQHSMEMKIQLNGYGVKKENIICLEK